MSLFLFVFCLFVFLFSCVEAQEHRLCWNDHWRAAYVYIRMADLVDLILLFLIYLNFAHV